MTWPTLFFGLLGLLLAAFLLAPGDIEGKSLAVLHGLCAQQPTHSLYFGEQRLPFDARMTGIYGGFAVTTLALILGGRWRSGGIPSLGIVVALAAGLALMGLDGVNSTLKDAGLPYIYEPHNALRLATGLLCGLALAAFIWLLVNQIAFAPDATTERPFIASWREYGLLLLLLIGFGGFVWLRWDPARVPLSFLLIISALTALTGLMLAFVMVVYRWERRAINTLSLAEPATFAVLWAVVLMGLLSGGRFLLEAALGLPSTV